MKMILYSVVVAWGLCIPATAQKIYRGKVDVNQKRLEIRGDSLLMEMNLSFCGLSVGRHQSLYLTPVIKQGDKIVALQSILIHGANKQKMYRRAQVLTPGKAQDHIYTAIKNKPSYLQELCYYQSVRFEDWMKNAHLVLMGNLCNYDGRILQVFEDILTEDLIREKPEPVIIKVKKKVIKPIE